MKIKEGVVPTILGTVVTATGLALIPVSKKVSWGVTGFGLAHVVLGAIDMVEHRK